MNDKQDVFLNGLMVKKPRDNAPEFVKCAISIKRSELISWLSQRTEDWINIDVKVSQKGKWYAQVNSWQPSKQDLTAAQQQATKPSSEAEFDDDIPF